MDNNELYKSYCIAFGESLKEIVQDVIKKKAACKDKKMNDFDTGYLCGFHRIITLMQQQAEIFELPFEELGIDIDENELI